MLSPARVLEEGCVIIQPHLFRSTAAKVAVVRLSGTAATVQRARRASWATSGIDAVLNELGVDAPLVPPERLDAYDVALLPLMSVADVLSAICELPMKRRCRIIAGGQGAYAAWALRDYVDRVCFGRAEDAVRDIVLGNEPLPFCWDPHADPDLVGSYVIRQASRLLPGERGVGCPRRCSFCQYTHTRIYFPRGASLYHPGRGYPIEETILSELHTTGPGRYTAGLDGWSEVTRRRVGKPITDEQVVDSLQRITSQNYDRPVVLKVFQIVGYPWESAASLAADIAAMGQLLRRADGCGRGRLVVMFLCTPFSPEPLTPMAGEPACVDVDWAGVVNAVGRQVYCGARIEAFILPQIASPLTLLKRVSVNRGLPISRLRRLATLGLGGWRDDFPRALRLADGIWKAGAGQAVSDYLGMPRPAAVLQRDSAQCDSPSAWPQPKNLPRHQNRCF